MAGFVKSRKSGGNKTSISSIISPVYGIESSEMSQLTAFSNVHSK